MVCKHHITMCRRTSPKQLLLVWSEVHSEATHFMCVMPLQVIALLLRSARKTGEPALLEEDEMDYSLKLNKELPPDIRVLAWCTVPADFSARHAFTLPCLLWVCLCLTCLPSNNSQVTTAVLMQTQLCMLMFA